MSYDNENNLNEQTEDSKKHINPFLIIIPIAVLCLFLFGIISNHTCLFSHNWKDASCEEPKTCIRCGKTEGEPLGHNWNEADCEKPKTCIRCGKTEGKPLGHNVTEWKTEKEATCTEGGTKTGLCITCGKNITEVIPASGHTPGDWEIGTEATFKRAGEKVQKCTKCGEIISKNTYELNMDEKLEKMFTITNMNISEGLSSDSTKFEFSVKNNTGTNIKYLELKLTLYDENGTAITSETSGYIEDIPINQIKEDSITIHYSGNYSYFKYSINAICVEGKPIIKRSEFNDDLISFIANGIPFTIN